MDILASPPSIQCARKSSFSPPLLSLPSPIDATGLRPPAHLSRRLGYPLLSTPTLISTPRSRYPSLFCHFARRSPCSPLPPRLDPTYRLTVLLSHASPKAPTPCDVSPGR
jgi:hypothetical protein